MKTQPDENRPIDTEAEDFAEEVRYAVEHHGKELHPQQKESHAERQQGDTADMPWQVD